MEDLTHSLYVVKKKNRRIIIVMASKENEEPMFRVITKRLVDFKTRHIAKSDTVYTLETFLVLADAMFKFKHDPKISKAINPFTNFEKWIIHACIGH